MLEQYSAEADLVCDHVYHPNVSCCIWTPLPTQNVARMRLLAMYSGGCLGGDLVGEEYAHVSWGRAVLEVPTRPLLVRSFGPFGHICRFCYREILD